MESNSDVEAQYRKVYLVEWCEEYFAESGIPEILRFRQGVAKHNNLKDLALACLIAPASKAIVERMFSLVTAIKTKPHNRTQIKSLDAHTCEVM